MNAPINGTPGGSEIPVIALASGKSFSVSPDGGTTLLMFVTPAGGRVILSVPTRGLRLFRAMLNDAMNAAEAAGEEAGTVVFKRPQSVQVGHSDQVRNHVGISFDTGSPGEATYLLSDQDALMLCRKIGDDVSARNATLRNGIALPRKGLILPGGNA